MPQILFHSPYRKWFILFNTSLAFFWLVLIVQIYDLGIVLMTYGYEPFSHADY